MGVEKKRYERPKVVSRNVEGSHALLACTLVGEPCPGNEACCVNSLDECDAPEPECL